LRSSFQSCFLAAALAVCAPLPAPAQDQARALPAILGRAAEYVAEYEDRQLGNVLTAETYLQTVTYYSGRAGVIGGRESRRLESDFLIVLVGDDRMGIRQVNRVDGVAVKNSGASLEALTDDSPAGVRSRIAALKEQSTRYNIGPVLRQINLPTFALKVLRREEAVRFSFVQRGTSRINGIQGVEIRFQELRSPTLVNGIRGESLPSSGAVWIEPATGRVLKTEFAVENPYAKAKGRITVTYSVNKTLGILVPDEMAERYETDDAVVNCTASYSRFRSFNVDLKSDIPAPGKR
jgi:hypothetical protein